MSAEEKLARVTEALREYEEQHPAMFDSEGETVRCFGGWLSDRGINLIGPSQAAPNHKPEYEPREFSVSATMMSGVDWSRVEKVQWTRNGKIIATGTLGPLVPNAHEDAFTFDVEPITATQPEDATDAYVEPEPLKEGDAVLVWARVDKTGLAGGTRVYLLDSGEGEWDAITSNDAIVRPSAGQVPPWINVATANVAAIARVLMDEGGMEHAAAFAHAESPDRAGIRAEDGAS
jgi:hypothetical protein